MNSTKRSGGGLGDNLYGIPLDDIYSPEEIEQLRQNPPVATRRRRKKRQKKIGLKKLNIKKFKLPEFNFTDKAVYIICAIAALLILLLIFKTPIIVRLVPELYVSEAMSDTAGRLKKEAARAIDGVFGFDVLGEKELTINLSGGVGADSKETISDMSVNVQAGYSEKSDNAAGMLQCLHGGEELASATVYFNNDEVGINIPQLFGEYWVAPAQTFGKVWNGSGLRKALYAGAVGEDADLSFDNLFKNRQILSDDGINMLSKHTRQLISSAEAVYEGKTELDVNGKSKRARSFKLTFSQESINEYLVALMDIISKDEAAEKYLSCLGAPEHTAAAFEDFKVRLTDSIAIGLTYLRLVEYKGLIKNASVHVEYIENGTFSAADFIILTDSSDNMIDSFKITFDSISGDNFYSYSLSTSGNHTGKGKAFTDTTTLTTSSPGYNYTMSSELSLDFKEGQAHGKLTGADIYGTKALSYSGTCSRKRGLQLALTEIWASAAGGVNRNLTGNAQLKISPDMTTDKISPSSKKQILDLTKAEADNYLKRLAETDVVKGFLLKLESIFGGAEQ